MINIKGLDIYIIAIDLDSHSKGSQFTDILLMSNFGIPRDDVKGDGKSRLYNKPTKKTKMNGVHLKVVIFSVCDLHVLLFFSLFSLLSLSLSRKRES